MTVQAAETEQAMMDKGTGAADVLALAAAPTFALMALLTFVLGGGQTDMICSAAHASALGGMIPMYLLMSAFHLAPWLKLIVRWRGRRHGPEPFGTLKDVSHSVDRSCRSRRPC
jgi:hypothetical protein